MRYIEFQSSDDRNTHSSISVLNTGANVVIALAAVFSVVVQWKDNPILALVLVLVAFLVALSTFVRPLAALIRSRRNRALRDWTAREQTRELQHFADRFFRIANSSDSSSFQSILFNLCGNNSEKFRELGPPDYLREFVPLFVGRLEAKPPRNEQEFVVAIQELRTLVSSYNSHYVTEPFRRMRSKTWMKPSQAGAAASGVEPCRDTWLMTLPELQREDAIRRIEDFRERWVGFLDEFRDWCERMSKIFGPNVSGWFERPQKL